MKNSTVIIAGAALLLILGGVFYVSSSPKGPAPLDGFAQCLKDNGVKFFGAFWCPHCQAQKKLFGGSVEKLPYIECSTPDGNGQTPVCTQNKIESYPTWVFPDGSTSTGELSLDELAKRGGCSLDTTKSTTPTSQSVPEATTTSSSSSSTTR